jgi:hypothetical protein
MKAIDDVLSERTEAPALGNGTDEDCLNAVLLTECRLMYCNVDLCLYIEEDFQLFFTETHQKLDQVTQHQKIKNIIKDIQSMVSIEGQKKEE